MTELLELSELNFAAQFDRPFLLDSSGGEIARVLGRLTNVTLLFDAAREANRRRLEVMGDLKRAEANLADLTEAAQRFRGMKERHAAVSEAEEAMERARQLTVRVAPAAGADRPAGGRAGGSGGRRSAGGAGRRPAGGSGREAGPGPGTVRAAR